jgi:hypothetical protein
MKMKKCSESQSAFQDGFSVKYDFICGIGVITQIKTASLVVDKYHNYEVLASMVFW